MVGWKRNKLGDDNISVAKVAVGPKCEHAWFIEAPPAYGPVSFEAHPWAAGGLAGAYHSPIDLRLPTNPRISVSVRPHLQEFS